MKTSYAAALPGTAPTMYRIQLTAAISMHLRCAACTQRDLARRERVQPPRLTRRQSRSGPYCVSSAPLRKAGTVASDFKSAACSALAARNASMATDAAMMARCQRSRAQRSSTSPQITSWSREEARKHARKLIPAALLSLALKPPPARPTTSRAPRL